MTAWDVDMAGSVTAGTAAMSIHGSQVGQTIGLHSIQDLTLDLAELNRLTSENGLTIGPKASIFVNGVTTASSDNIGTLTLVCHFLLLA